jgi:hypothetical protein
LPVIFVRNFCPWESLISDEVLKTFVKHFDQLTGLQPVNGTSIGCNGRDGGLGGNPHASSATSKQNFLEHVGDPSSIGSIAPSKSGEMPSQNLAAQA